MTKKNNEIYQRHDKPISFRIPLNTHKKYKDLTSMRKKEINYKFNIWIKKQINMKDEYRED